MNGQLNVCDCKGEAEKLGLDADQIGGDAHTDECAVLVFQPTADEEADALQDGYECHPDLKAKQDAIAYTPPGETAAQEQADNALLNQAFTREGQSDWMRSLKQVAKAQALLWSRTPLLTRQALLAEVAHAKEAK